MKILLGIGHPSDVHFFKNFIAEMESRGHEVFVAAREKEFTCFLLNQFNIPFHKISIHQKTILSKLFEYVKRWARTYKLCRRIQPDIALGVGDFYLPQIGKLAGFPTIVITDTEPAVHDFFLTFPFATYILTPSCFKQKIKGQIFYNSYNELAYLSKKRFTPDPKIYKLLGIKSNQRYVILRFIDRTAVHDIGCRKLASEIKNMAVSEFSKYARVFISSEQELSEDLKKFQLPCPPEYIHHVLYYADLLYGDSATMASEAACLGTPAIYVDDRGRGYTDEQERRYGLVFNFQRAVGGCASLIHPTDQERSIRKGIEILTATSVKEEWRKKRDRMLGDKVELTDFLVEFVG